MKDHPLATSIKSLGPAKNVLKAVNNELIGLNSDDMHAEEAVLNSFIKTEFSTIIKEIDLIVITKIYAMSIKYSGNSLSILFRIISDKTSSSFL